MPKQTGNVLSPSLPVSGCVAELQGRMRDLQGELKAECERFRQTQDALANARKDLTIREQSLQRAKDELSLAHTRISQESERVRMHTLTLHETRRRE